MNKKAVIILFDGLTHGGKLYSVGDIERNPTEYLLECARNRTQQLHRDTNRMVPICKFYKDEQHRLDMVDDIIEKRPFVSGGYDDDLDDKKKAELITIASTLGMKKDPVRIMNRAKIKKIIRFLRKV